MQKRSEQGTFRLAKVLLHSVCSSDAQTAVWLNRPGCFGKSWPSQIPWKREIEAQLWKVCNTSMTTHVLFTNMDGWTPIYCSLGRQQHGQSFGFFSWRYFATDHLNCFSFGDKFLSLFKVMTKMCYVDMAFSDNSPAGAKHVSLPQRLRISRGLPKEAAESSR